MTKKNKIRANGEGTIRKRADGRYEAMIRYGNGQRKSAYAKTQAAARELLEQMKRDVHDGITLSPSDQTVREYLESWLATLPGTIEVATETTYQSYVRNHIAPIAQVRLADLTAQHIQQLYSKELKAGLSSTSVNHLHSILHNAFKQAVAYGVMRVNVTELVKAPRIQRPNWHTFNREETARFIEAVQSNRFAAAFILAVTTGMRQGEILGLQWKHVNLATGIIRVQTALKFQEHRFQLLHPKSSSSRRTIILSEVAKSALERHEHQQEQAKVVAGSAWDSAWNLVFANSIGRPMNASNLLGRDFKQILRANQLPMIRFHDLRHTCASLLLEAGVHIKIVSELLGHSSITLTLNTYSHVIPGMHGRAAEAMDSLFASGGQSGGQSGFNSQIGKED